MGMYTEHEMRDIREHLRGCRERYVKATLEQRIRTIHDRLNSPNAGATQLFLMTSAAESLARAIATKQIALRQDRDPIEVYEDSAALGCGRSPRCATSGQLLDWLDTEANAFALDKSLRKMFDIAVKYRNFIAHECAYVSRPIFKKLIGACEEVFEILKKRARARGLLRRHMR